MSQNRVFLALGSNEGSWKIIFNNCLREFKNLGELLAIGNIYISKPYGYKNQNNFYNTAIELSTVFEPKQLMKKIQFIEKKLYKKKKIS